VPFNLTFEGEYKRHPWEPFFGISTTACRAGGHGSAPDVCDWIRQAEEGGRNPAQNGLGWLRRGECRSRPTQGKAVVRAVTTYQGSPLEFATPAAYDS